MQAYMAIILDHFSALWNSVCALCTLKIIMGVLIGILWYLLGQDNQAVLLALLTLIGIDFITALVAAFKNKIPIESRRALKSASKVVVYAMFISAGHLTSQIVLNTTWIETAVISFLALTELVSIMENLGHMGYVTPNVLLGRLRTLRDSQ